MTSAPLFASPALAASPSASASAAAAADEAIPPELLAEGRGDLIDDRALLNYHLELRTVKKLVVEERRPTAGDAENGDDAADLYGDRRKKVRETTVEILVPRRNDRDVMEALQAAEDPSEAAEFEAALQLLFAKAVLGEEHAVDEEEFDDELLLREEREQMEREQQQEQQRRQQAEEQERATPPPPVLPGASVATAATPTVKHVTLVDPRATPADSRRHPSSAFAGKTPQERAARDDDDDNGAAVADGATHALPAASTTVIGASPAPGAARSSPHRHISPQQLRNKRRELQREREQHAQRVVQQALALADDIDTTSMIINTPEQLLRRQQRGLLQQQEAAARGETGGGSGSGSGGGIHHRVSAMLKLMYRDIESRQWRFETEKAIMAHKAQLEEEQRRLREQGRAVVGGAAMSPGSPGGNSNNNRGSAASAAAVDAHSLAAGGGSGDPKDVSDALIDQLGNSSGIDQSVMSVNSNSTPARAGRQRRRRTVVVRHAKKPSLPPSAETPAESNLDSSMTTTTALASPLDASVSGGGAAGPVTEYVEEYEEVEEDEEEDGEGGDRSGASPAHQQHHNRFGSPGAGSLAGAASAAALAQRMRASIGAGRRAGPGGLLGGGSIGPGSGGDGGAAGGRRRASDEERGVFASLFHELKAFQQAERSGGGGGGGDAGGGNADGRAPRPAPKQIQEMLDAYLAREESRKRHRPLSYADDDMHGAASVVAHSTHRSERGGSSPLDERSNSNINSPSASRKRYATVASPKRALACINAIEEVEANLARATRNLAAVTHKTPFTGTLPAFVVGPDNARVDRQEYLQELVQAKRSRLAENYAHRAEDPLSDPLHRGNHIRRLQEMTRKKQLQDARFRRRLERMQEEMRRQGKVVSTLEHEGYNDDDDGSGCGGADRNELSGGDAGSGEFDVGQNRGRSPAEKASEDATKFTSQKHQPQHRRDSSGAHTSDPGLPIVQKFRERTKMAFGRKAASAHIGPDSLFYKVDKLQRARDKEDEASGGTAKKQRQHAAGSKTGADEKIDASVASGAALPPLQSGGWWQEQQSKNPDAVPPKEAYDAPLSLSAVAAANPAVGAMTPVKRRAISSKTPTPLGKNRTPLRNSSSTAGATPSPAAASDAAATPSAARRYFELSKPVDRRFVKM